MIRLEGDWVTWVKFSKWGNGLLWNRVRVSIVSTEAGITGTERETTKTVLRPISDCVCSQGVDFLNIFCHVKPRCKTARENIFNTPSIKLGDSAIIAKWSWRHMHFEIVCFWGINSVILALTLAIAAYTSARARKSPLPCKLREGVRFSLQKTTGHQCGSGFQQPLARHFMARSESQEYPNGAKFPWVDRIVARMTYTRKQDRITRRQVTYVKRL